MKAQITVIKKAFHKDAIDQYLPEIAERAEICPVFQDGQTFVVNGPFPSKPEGFYERA